MYIFWAVGEKMILIILLYAIFSAMTFINSALMDSNPYPLMVGMIRALGSGIIILGYMLIFRRAALLSIRLSRQQWRWLIAYAVLIHAVAMCAFSFSVLYANPVTVCFMFAMAPFITALIQYLHGQERLTPQKFCGLVVGVIGLVPILIQSSYVGHASPLKSAALGNWITFGAMILFCYGWVLFKKLLQSCHYSIQMLNGIAMMIGGLLSVVMVLAVHGVSLGSLSYSSDFGWLMAAFLASSLITYSLYAYLLQHFSPTFISFAGFLEPAFGMIYGFFLVGYQISGIDLASFFVLFLGLYIFYLDELNKKRGRKGDIESFL